MCRGLLLGRNRFAQRQNLRHDWFDFPRVDQLRDLCQVFRIRMGGDTRSVNPMFLELDWIRTRNQRHDNAAFLHHAVRTRECFLADRIEHGVHILGDIFKFGFRIIHCHVCAELLQEILVGSRRGRYHACTARFRDLDREASDTA